ncbi:DUF2922 domain-containing protein [Desulfitibacter alkalitolerans]|uniref:DUF2922 domain-containing protein n=1 Tax=Desulfitibacter alkalitolerans TaxID=264641 RepID=UPI0004834084|nr:DUF2922 domain-containing protein [Desulfitibacter alkalitolerans]
MLTRRLELQFFNEAGTRATIGLDDPKEDLTDVEVRNAMESILAEDVFTSPRGDLVAIAGARIVAREVTEFSVAE